jgi:hypothetical protein
VTSSRHGSGANAVGRQLRKAWSDILSGSPLGRVLTHWRKEYGLLAVAIGSALIAHRFIGIAGKAPDFTVFWAAATHAFGPVYDSNFISPLQNAPPGPRPFANPPTFLLLLLPVGLLPFKLAYVAWVSVSVAAYFAAGLRLTKFAWLAVFSPTFLFVALIGQTTLLAGSLAVLGLALAKQRSVFAGIALGIAACIKPQLVILAPLALILLKDVRAILAAGLTALTLVLAATAMFGIAIWSDWIQSLAGFRAITAELNIGQLALPRSPAILIGCAIVIVSFMALAVRRADRPRLIIATIGGSLLLASYSAHYESVVLLLPALALLRLDWRILPIGYLISGGAVTTLPFALVIFLLCLPARVSENKNLPSHHFDELPRTDGDAAKAQL